jgi:hypothetical protein
MMNLRKIAWVLVGLSALAVVGGGLFKNHSGSEVIHTETNPRTRQSVEHPPVPARNQDSPQPGSEVNSGTESERPLLRKEEIVPYLEEASTRYDETSVQLISPYLDNQDPEVRNAAVNAMLVSGRASGAGPLRLASKRLIDPHEAVSYLEAVDYLELPSYTPKSRKKH